MKEISRQQAKDAKIAHRNEKLRTTQFTHEELGYYLLSLFCNDRKQREEITKLTNQVRHLNEELVFHRRNMIELKNSRVKYEHDIGIAVKDVRGTLADIHRTTAGWDIDYSKYKGMEE